MARLDAHESWYRIARAEIEPVGPLRFAPNDPLRRDSASPQMRVLGRQVPSITYQMNRFSGPSRVDTLAAAPRPQTPGSLWSFVRLKSASDDAILRFAKTWGPLGLCQCGKRRPTRMPAPSVELGDRHWVPEHRPLSFDEFGTYGSRPKTWRFYAWQFSAVLRTRLSSGKGTPHRRAPRPSRPFRCCRSEEALTLRRVAPSRHIVIERSKPFASSSPTYSWVAEVPGGPHDHPSPPRGARSTEPDVARRRSRSATGADARRAPPRPQSRKRECCRIPG